MENNAPRGGISRGVQKRGTEVRWTEREQRSGDVGFVCFGGGLLCLIDAAVKGFSDWFCSTSSACGACERELDVWIMGRPRQ